MPLFIAYTILISTATISCESSKSIWWNATTLNVRIKSKKQEVVL